MSSTRAYRTAAVFLAWLILRGQVPGFAETAEDRIYWADMDGIYWSNLQEGTTQRIITADTRRPGKIAVDVHGGKMYWVDKRGGTIQWSDLDGSNSEWLIGPQAHGLASDLDLDLDRGKIYFSVLSIGSDAVDGGVYRANLDGSDVEFLGREFPRPRTLVVDPASDLVYLTDWYGIYQLDRKGFEYVLESNSLRDVALDLVNDKVYWTDPEERAIRRSDRDGSNVEDVLTELEDTPGEIALDPEEGKVYWTLLYDGGTFYESYGGLLRANLDGSEVEYVVERGEVVGFTLDLQGRKVYWTEARGTIHRANLDGSNVEDLFAPQVRAPYAVALDAREERIYWSDLLSGTVQRADADGSEHEILVEGLDTPKGVCLGGDRIYWADGGAGKIQSARLDGSDLSDLATERNHPDKVALDPVHGRIYWTERNARRINRADLDGSDIGAFSVDGRPKGIALDVSRGKLYWTWSGGISRSSLEGTDVENLVTGEAYSDYKAIALDLVGGGSTLISYTLAAPGPVSLVVYNTLGQPVQTLVDQAQAPGLYSVPWQPAETLASGVYLYRLTTSDAVLTRRLALLR